MRIGVAAAVVALSALGLVGCTQSAQQADGPPVIVPGKPGETASTVLSGVTATQDPPNDADLAYVQMMIPHHQQALEMTALAPQRASNETVRGLAARIADTQGPEAKAMQSWQQQFGGPHAGHGGHTDHSSMPGMATADQIAALKAATGAPFDELFLRLMTAHHEGALKMAKELLTTGRDVRVEEMAQDIIATQTDEIARMKALATP
jgi:uncharacterized protein (DUF305 family)